MTELAAWILFPLVALAICAGIGLLARRVADAEVDAAALPALGLAAAIAVLGPLAATGAGEWWAFALLALPALAGFAAEARMGRGAPDSGDSSIRPGAGFAAGVAAYALFIAPIALSGEATFLGYNLLNDTAIHLALVDWVGQHGSQFIAQPPSSFGATINDYVQTRYPLGSHELLAALRPATGLDASAIYQPFLAFCAAIAAAAIVALVRRHTPSARVAAIAGLAAVASQLVFSFSLQGGIKELSFIVCLTAAAALATRRAAVLIAVPAAAMYGIYGVYALPWIAPLALLALVLIRPTLRQLGIATAVFLALIAPDIPDSLDYYRHGVDVITSGAELGPLAGPLNLLQASGIWLNGDYRFAPSPYPWISYLLAAVVLGLALAGIVLAVRRRATAPLLFLVPVLVAFAVTAPNGSPYIDAKLLTILSPALILAAAIALPAIAPARIALAAALVLGGALLVSDGLAYRVALVAPADRLDELAEIDERFAGRGPILVNEFEEYTKHFMRRSRGSDPYEGWTAARAQLRNPRLPVAAHAYDLDELTDAFVQRWRLIAVRRSPVASRPPSNFERVFGGEYYEVWERRRAAPVEHIPLGSRVAPAAALDCERVATMRRHGRVVGAVRPAPLLVPIATLRPLPAGWAASGQSLTTNKGGSISTSFVGRGPVRVWVGGRAFRDLELRIDGRRVGSVRHLNGPNQWMEAGRVELSPAEHTLELVRPTRSLRPGDAQRDVIGPVAVAPDAEPRLLEGEDLERACRLGVPADWIERY